MKSDAKTQYYMWEHEVKKITKEIFMEIMKMLEDEEKIVYLNENPKKLTACGKEPSYYNSNGLSPLEAFKMGLLSKEEYIGFCKGNIIKYTVRAGKKDDAIEDIYKAIDYLNHLKEAFDEK